jgi:hypothetical protein
MFKAVLSTVVIPVDGTYTVRTISEPEYDRIIEEMQGVPHYVGHPDTKSIVERFGAIPAASKLFEGLQPGESAICFPIVQGKTNRAVDGYSQPHQAVTIIDLCLRVITRIDS